MPQPIEDELLRKENIRNGFENFLVNWIDSGKLMLFLDIDSNTFGAMKKLSGIFTNLPSGIPDVISLKAYFTKKGQSLNEDKVHILCEFMDKLLDYVIYVFKYYSFDFITKDGRIDSQNEANILLAKRLTKMYKIISKYIIGNPDLSQKEVRKEANYKSRHRSIFKLGEEKSISIAGILGIFQNPTKDGKRSHEETEYIKKSKSKSRGGGTRKLRQDTSNNKTYKAR